MALTEAVSGRAVPAWFVEGFALHFSREAEWTRGWSLYRAAVRRGTHDTSTLDHFLEKGGSEATLALAEGADFLGFLLKPEKHAKFAAAVERLRQGDELDAALASGYGSARSAIEREWLAELGRRTTVTSVLLGVGFPGILLAGYAVVRALRRRRLRLAGTKRADRKALRAATSSDRARVHIVFSRRDERPEPDVIAETEVPKVEHEGQWHTLH
jgi:hypothetical protein